MVKLTDDLWIARLAHVDYAFQPIVNIHTGNAFGFEALLRHHEEAGFDSIGELFDAAWADGVLHQVDLVLREKALRKFAGFKRSSNLKLFFNLDNRLLDSQDYSPGNTVSLLTEYGYSRDDLCFEISERHKICGTENVTNTLAAYRTQRFKIAVDDCGAGFSGLQLIYYTEPDYIKIDRFFIQNLGRDPKKRLLVSTIVNLAHFMGSLVMAEGVETRDEYFSCKEIGCDMVQGYFVQRPQLDLDRLKTRYTDIHVLTLANRRKQPSRDRSLIDTEINYIKPVYEDCDLITIFDRFGQTQDYPFIPVLNRYEEPLGIVRDSSFKHFVFSKFGRQLLENPSFGKDIKRFLTRVPIADIYSSVEALIELYTQYQGNEGLLVVDSMKYIGFLSPQALLKMINEKNLSIARNQNPLTKLPGNTLIHEYFSQALADTASFYFFIYFDFDNFKSFNDTYGFRNGDRLILLFSDLLKGASHQRQRFAGHVGGDDFFLGIRNGDRDRVEEEMRLLGETFRKSAESFYDRDAIANGYITAKNRHGIESQIPLVTVSIAVLELPGSIERFYSIEQVGSIIAQLKKEAKKTVSRFFTASIEEFDHVEAVC